MSAYPTTELTLADWLDSTPIAGTYSVSNVIGDGLTAYANIAVRPHADNLIVFLPGAQSSSSQRRIPYFHRWTWQDDLPDSHVMALCDPSIALDDRLRGGWFMHRNVDLIKELARFTLQVAATLSIPPRRVTFHGSSLGGFGAIGLAVEFRGSSAVAEIPQIDVERWPVPSAIKLLEDLVGQPLSEFRKVHPERVSVLERIRQVGLVPPITLITNEKDPSYADQLNFIDEVSRVTGDYAIEGDVNMVITEVVSGHSPLPKQDALELLRRIAG